MTRFDFSPLFEPTPSLDDHFRLLGSALDLSDAAAAYPPFNVEKRGEDRYRIVIAVAGFGPEDLEVEVRGNRLSVVGDKGQGVPALSQSRRRGARIRSDLPPGRRREGCRREPGERPAAD